MSTQDEKPPQPTAANEFSDPDLWSQIEAESKNFEVTTKYLGNTVELVQDFQDVYKTLAGFVLIPDGGDRASLRNVEGNPGTDGTFSGRPALRLSGFARLPLQRGKAGIPPPGMSRQS
jgi:hypothetical protein